jgi:hypothetical protein
MDTFRLDNLAPFFVPTNSTKPPCVAMKLGLAPKERPVSLLQLLIEETLAPHIHIIDSRIAHPLVEFDVDKFVDAAIDRLVVPGRPDFERETSYFEAA